MCILRKIPFFKSTEQNREKITRDQGEQDSHSNKSPRIKGNMGSCRTMPSGRPKVSLSGQGMSSI